MTKDGKNKFEKLLNNNLKDCVVSIYPACFFPPAPKDKKDPYIIFVSYTFRHKTEETLCSNCFTFSIDWDEKTIEQEAQNIIQVVLEAIEKDPPLNPDLFEYCNPEYRFPYPDDLKTLNLH